MHSNQMPMPTDIIECADGASCIAFLFYLGEAANRDTARRVAASHGHDLEFVDFDEDASEELGERYADGENILPDWQPSSPGDGWQFAGKWDTEEMPMSAWIKRKPLPAGVTVVPAGELARLSANETH